MGEERRGQTCFGGHFKKKSFNEKTTPQDWPKKPEHQENWKDHNKSQEGKKRKDRENTGAKN